MLKRYKYLKNLSKVIVEKEDTDVDNLDKAKISYDIYDDHSGEVVSSNVFHLTQSEIQSMIDTLQTELDDLATLATKKTEEKEDLEELLLDVQGLGVAVKVKKP